LGVRVSHFLSVLLLVTAVVLTVCFGVGLRISDEPGVDITGQIPHQSYGLKPTLNRKVSGSRESNGPTNARLDG